MNTATHERVPKNPPQRVGRAVKETVRYGIGPTPIGPILVAVTSRGICALFLLEGDNADSCLARLSRAFRDAEIVADPTVAATIIPAVAANLKDGISCDELPLDLRGTPFQLRVWEALRAIPRGRTTTYGALAARLGLDAGSARAVGSACGANPVALVVPCHRVLRSGGGLGGFYYGLDCKRRLLDMETAEAPETEKRAARLSLQFD